MVKTDKNRQKPTEQYSKYPYTLFKKRHKKCRFYAKFLCEDFMRTDYAKKNMRSNHKPLK